MPWEPSAAPVRPDRPWKFRSALPECTLAPPKRRNEGRPVMRHFFRGGKSGGAQKCVIVGLVNRGRKARMFYLNDATAAAVRDALVRNVDRESILQTDSSRLYPAPERNLHRTRPPITPLASMPAARVKCGSLHYPREIPQQGGPKKGSTSKMPMFHSVRFELPLHPGQFSNFI